MAAIDTQAILQLAPQLLRVPHKRIWSSYDEKADVLYLSFKKPSHADDSELTDDDIIIRYEGDEVVGITVLHASKCRPPRRAPRRPLRNRGSSA